MVEPIAGEPRQAFLSGRISMLVRLTAQDGMRPALLEVLNSYTDQLAGEPGTEVFIVSIDPDDVNNVWLYEIFKDDDAQTAHRSSQGFATLMHSMPSLLDGSPAILRMDPLRMSLQETVLTQDWTI
jgi:quinol monooxygenase YgiN